MRASRIGERPRPRKRTLTLNAAFFVGMGLVVALAWWVHGDEPPGLRGEPDFSPWRGAPFLVEYGAPSCDACVAQWRTLQPTLPGDLRVVHLLTRDANGSVADAAALEDWAARLRVPRASVLPADLTRSTLPAVVLRNGRARWRFEHAGPWDADARARFERALRLERPPPQP